MTVVLLELNCVCAHILKALAKAAWCLWRVSTVILRAFGYNSARSEAIGIKIGAL